jgi:hypothetical protein
MKTFAKLIILTIVTLGLVSCVNSNNSTGTTEPEIVINRVDATSYPAAVAFTIDGVCKVFTSSASTLCNKTGVTMRLGQTYQIKMCSDSACTTCAATAQSNTLQTDYKYRYAAVRYLCANGYPVLPDYFVCG